ncbi:MAG TPA: M23 family metallopeptidase [Conexibacter sp.]|nr:M23 family metallopeptidase [Conexibacter sp.]
MARSIRATSLLLITLGAASAALPATAAAANAGGAAPGSEVAGTPSTGVQATGGAAPGVEPPRGASSSRTGGALAGRKPPRRVVKRQPSATPPVAPRRAAPRAPPVVTTVAGTFPVQGTFSFGGDDARFGAGRPGHRHQGQDVVAPSGTPLVAPVAGSVTWKANQPGGAGIYLVVRGAADQRDYVFMHIKRGTVLVTPGTAVVAGQQLAQVGATGAASGPHLHFEIWVGGWWERGGMPVDPLPQLQRWAGL